MDVDGGKEYRRARGMHITYQPAVIHVAHDVLDGLEGAAEGRHIMHREDDAGHDHDHQYDAGERSEIPKIVQIPWRRIFVQLVMQESEDRQPIIDPADDWIRKLCTAHAVLFGDLRRHLHFHSVTISWCLENAFNGQTQPGRLHLNAVPRERHFVTTIVRFLEVKTELIFLDGPFADFFLSI